VPRSRDPENVLPLNSKPFLLLLVLEERGALHGYALKKEMLERSGGTVRMDPGGMYRLIARLERDGLVRRADPPAADLDERRQYIMITDWGRAVLAAEARRIAALARMPAVQQLASGR
jgi:DNA-binding PadR family transcriptional regulator